MKKNFLTITPESEGEGTASINVAADPNPKFKDRSETLTVASTGGGLTKTLNINQIGVPWFCTIGMAPKPLFDAGEIKWMVNWLVLPSAPPTIDGEGGINQTLYLPREWFPRDASGTDVMTEQWLDISLLVHKDLYSISELSVEVDWDVVQLSSPVAVGDYYHFSAFSKSNAWMITPKTQEKTVAISFDGGSRYNLIYNIQSITY